MIDTHLDFQLLGLLGNRATPQVEPQLDAQGTSTVCSTILQTWTIA